MIMCSQEQKLCSSTSRFGYYAIIVVLIILVNFSHQLTQECVACTPGTFSNESLDQCRECQKDNHTDSGKCLDLKYCTLCATGTYQNSSGNSKCEPCPIGYECSTLGCKQCHPCKAGSYSDQNGTAICNQCPIGMYQPNSASFECLPCPAGSESLIIGASECTPCKMGFYKNETNDLKCAACPPGFFTNNTGSSNCDVCSAGTYSEYGKRTCQKCPVSTYCPVEGCGSCTHCEPGMFTMTTGSVDCTCCGPGFYKNDDGHDGCHRCSSGYYTDLFCRSSCTICPANYYCPCPYCKYECPADSVCPEGSSAPGTCSSLTTISTDKSTGIKSCVWSAELYTIVIGSSLGFVFVALILACTVCRKRKNSQQSPIIDESTVLVTGRKDSSLKQPSYTGL